MRGLGGKLAGSALALGLGALSVAPAASAAPKLPVTVDLGRVHHSDLSLSGRLPVALELPRAGRVSVSAALGASDGTRTELVKERTVSLRAGTRRTVRLALAAPARAALAGCPAARVLVTISDPTGRARARSASTKLRLNPPDCARFFHKRAFWNTPVTDAELDPASPDIVAELLRQIDESRNDGMPPSVNTNAYAAPLVTVPAGQPRVRVKLDQPPNYAPDLATAFASVPVPPHTRAAPGTDQNLVVWQPATDTLWEFWRFRPDGNGWQASWGGRLDEVSTGPAVYEGGRRTWGATASSLPLAGGVITPRELRRGQIDHALGVGIPQARRNAYALPAQRTDGESACRFAPPEGARFRLDPAVDVESLDLPPAAKTIAHAVQRYGMIVGDQSGAVAFAAQGTRGMESDPYPELFGGLTPWDLIARFPWSRLQLVRMDLVTFGDEPLLPGVLDECG
jgi:hypothetical protein